MSTCGTCRHALPIDPLGHWREKYGYDWPTTHVHCALDERPRIHVYTKGGRCGQEENKWEPIDGRG